jgi:hypothetical protein
MVELDTLKAEGKMLEVAQAWLILPSFGWDLPNLEASELVLEESQVVSLIPFYLAGFRVFAHPFVWRFLHHFRLWLHDLTPQSVAHLVVFVTLYEGYLGIEPHFDLWRWIFHLNLNKDGDESVQWIGTAAIQLCNNLKSRYLELSFPTSEKGWHQKFFYLSDPSGSLLAYSLDRIGPVTPSSWKSLPEGHALEVVKGCWAGSPP